MNDPYVVLGPATRAVLRMFAIENVEAPSEVVDLLFAIEDAYVTGDFTCPDDFPGAVWDFIVAEMKPFRFPEKPETKEQDRHGEE